MKDTRIQGLTETKRRDIQRWPGKQLPTLGAGGGGWEGSEGTGAHPFRPIPPVLVTGTLIQIFQDPEGPTLSPSPV